MYIPYYYINGFYSFYYRHFANCCMNLLWKRDTSHCLRWREWCFERTRQTNSYSPNVDDDYTTTACALQQCMCSGVWWVYACVGVCTSREGVCVCILIYLRFVHKSATAVNSVYTSVVVVIIGSGRVGERW